jgi:hypothetical protein
VDPPQTLLHGRSTERLPAPPRRRSQADAHALVLDRYRLIRRLGAGGFGVVWEAHDELLGREVALKCISLPAEADRERARREALVSARLNHPAIVALYEAHCEQDEFYLASELVRGHTLERWIAADQLSDRHIAQIGGALCEALEHAHAHGVVHRDVKPQNVLIAEHPSEPGAAVKLADFGGAHLAGAQALTHTGDVLGTLAYMAPEQFEGRKAGDYSDLYSLALVLYEAFSGTNPVRGQNPAATVRRIGMPIPALRRYRQDMDADLAVAIDCALATQPQRRGTLEQLGAALEQHAEEHGTAARIDVTPAALRRSRTHSDPQQEPYLDEIDDRPSLLALPRACWWACAVGAIVWQALAGRTGVALLLVCAALPLLALPRRCGPWWALASLAPALGSIGLAGAFPVLAALRSNWRARIGLAALGYWWLTLSGPLLGRRLWLPLHPGMPARSAWESSLHSTATGVLSPTLGLGVLLGAALWSGGSLVLPWLVRGRRFALDAVLVSVWAALLIAAQPLLDSGLPIRSGAPTPRGLIFSMAVGAAVFVGTRALRGPV